MTGKKITAKSSVFFFFFLSLEPHRAQELGIDRQRSVCSLNPEGRGPGPSWPEARCLHFLWSSPSACSSFLSTGGLLLEGEGTGVARPLGASCHSR